MTRFARSKGSKASNERVEEDATPWEQLTFNMAPTAAKQHFDVEDLDDDGIDYEQEDNDQSEKSDSEPEQDEEEKSNVPKNIDPQDKKKEVDGSKKRKRNQNKCLNCKEPGHLKKECPKLSEERRKELQDLYQMKIERKGEGTGRKKGKRELEKVLDVSEKEQADPSEPKAKKSKEQADPSEPKAKKSKRKKIKKDKTGNIVQEGEGLFQGFRVLQQDVQKLRDLAAKLTKDKATPDQIKETLKRERRKAENALANSKKDDKKVCFKCREPGHRLNECPKLSEKVGKCFKCGSGEHTSKTCVSKLKGADAYKFADCFVCGQKGHLAKACPDNPKGLYPKGGGCRFCGSVEHLKSECPRKSVKDAKSNFTAKRHSERDNIEDEVDLNKPRSQPAKNKKKPNKSKVVTF